MKVSNLVQAKTRKDSSFDLVHVPTLSALDMPLLLQFPDRGESTWQLNWRKTRIDVIYLIPPPPTLFRICINNIIIIIIICSSSVCWSLQSAETNGQYLSWETWAAPARAPRVSVRPQPLPGPLGRQLFYCT